MTCLRVIIRGRVQGVGFRAWTAKTASAQGVSGWVRNRTDGTVEAVFSGDDTAVSILLAACRNGPMLARVDAIEHFNHDEQPDAGFMSLPTL